MERGLRVSALEKQAIQTHKPEVFVSYQRSGYKDSRTELRILQNVFKAETEKRAGEFVLIQDQLKTHKIKAALE
jgi:hypothetical protein